jgi:hypothetical protein
MTTSGFQQPVVLPKVKGFGLVLAQAREQRFLCLAVLASLYKIFIDEKPGSKLTNCANRVIGLLMQFSDIGFC